MKNHYHFLLIALITLLSFQSFAQITSRISRISVPASIEEQQPFSISAEFVKDLNIQRITLYYRTLGESEYNQLEMLISGRTATATIPSEKVATPAIEYYIYIALDQGVETYPISNPSENPSRVNVIPINPKNNEARILSPEPGETVSTDEFVVVLSLYYAGDNIAKKATHLYIDNQDVSKDALYAEDIITYAPKTMGKIRLGAHTIKVELRDTTGALYHTVQTTFNLTTTFSLDEEKSKVRIGISGQGEYRNEIIDTTGTAYARFDLRAFGNHGEINFGTSLHLDNQENPERQPQNRFLIYGETSFLRLQYGDTYPTFPSDIVSGKRVRGLNANLTTGYFNLDVTYGVTDRAINEILYDSLYYADTSAIKSRDKYTILINDTTYKKYLPGTYDRKFMAIRPSFGKGENFQFGFTYLKSKDDISSVSYGKSPEENLVVGTDLMLSYDNDRIRWESQASIAVSNTDISEGSFTQADYDSLKANDPKTGQDLEDLGKIADKFITVNANIFPTNPIGEGLPGLAFESIFSLNYFNNYLRASIFRRGAGYRSFGNDFIQNDIAGYYVSDRIRMLSNKIFLTVSYENKSDNTADTKIATTTYSNLNTTINLNLSSDIPSFTIGYGMLTRQNDHSIYQDTSGLFLLPLADQSGALGSTSNTLGADEASSRLYISSMYDFVFGPKHTVSLSFSTLKKEDKTFFKRDQDNLNLQFSLTSFYSVPLQTSIGFLYSLNKSYAQSLINISDDSVGLKATYNSLGNLIAKPSPDLTEFSYTSIVFALQYKMLGDDLRLTGIINPTFGDFKRFGFTAGADYTVAPGHNIEVRLDLMLNTIVTSGLPDRNTNDFITSLIYRYEL